MEFGCRYIYVDESRGEVKNPAPQLQNGIDVPGHGYYDNRKRNELVPSTGINGHPQGLSQPGQPPGSKDSQPGCVSTAEQWKTPPPIPDRMKKPPMLRHPGVLEPNNGLYDNYSCKADPASSINANELQQELNTRLTPDANIYLGFQLLPSPKPERKTPPPVPERKKKPSAIRADICTSALNRVLHVSKRCANGESFNTLNLKQQNIPPPIPVKPSAYQSGIAKSVEYDYAYEEVPDWGVKPNETLQDCHTYMDLPPAICTETSAQDCKPTERRASVIPGVPMATNMPVYSDCYLDVLPALPMEIEMQKTPPHTPNRCPSPALQQELNTRLSSEANICLGLQLPPSPKPGRKTPPPVPERKTKPSTIRAGIAKSAEYDYAYYEEVPEWGMKPNETLQDCHTCMDLPSAICTENSAQDCKPTERRASVIPGVSMATDMPVYSDCYLNVLPALPMEIEMQKTPPHTPDRCPSPEQRLPANCNILLLNIGKMVEDPGIENLGFPLLCRSCLAAFSELSNVKENKTWSCDFCSTENLIAEHTELICTGGDQLYLQETACNVYTTDDDPMLIFCIDISGSMSVTIEVPEDQTNNCTDHNIYQSRMEAVKSGLSETLHFLHRQNPRTRVAFLTFSDQVKIYGDGTIQSQVLEDCELLDTDYLKLQGENQPVPHILEETLHLLEANINCLQENGATALGPAALVSIAMASKRPGSKVIICTDGRANTDLGNLEDITEEYVYQSSKLYYSNLGHLALQHSVVVSVVTIEGTDCRLTELGQLADKTGGKVNIVHPLHLAKEFQSILNEQVNATDVEVKVYLPRSMHFLYEEHTEPVLKRKLGCTSPDTMLSAEFAIHSSKTKEALRYSQLPVQVQITFTLPDGESRHRIVSQKKPVTNDSIAALEAIDLNALKTHSVQFCARLAMEGHLNEATKVALELKELIDLVMRHEKYEDQGVVYEDWENTMAPIYEDLQVYVQGGSSTNNNVDTTEIPALKSFSDEMAKMIFHMKRAKRKVMNRWKNQAE